MSTQPHKHVGDEGKPGQIVNPINHDMMEDMGRYADAGVTRRGNPKPFNGTRVQDLPKRVTWEDPTRTAYIMQAVAAMREALDAGASLQDIIKLL